MDKIERIFTRANAKNWPVELEKTLRVAWQSTEKDLKITVEEYIKNRSVQANKLQRLWFKESQAQGDMTAEEYRGYCKLHFGVAIAKENEDFAEKYDRLIRSYDYEQKLELMMVPMDMPITRIMNTSQYHRYLNKVFTHLTGLGFKLTEPKDEYWEAILKQAEG